MNRLTQQQIAKKRGCSLKTVQRDLTTFNVRPVDVQGRLRFYDPDEVAAMEVKKKAAALAAAGGAVKGIKLPTLNHLRTERRKAVRK